VPTPGGGGGDDATPDLAKSCSMNNNFDLFLWNLWPINLAYINSIIL
jgi:hypothetical protein